MTDPNEKPSPEREPDAAEELKAGFSHLLNAAKKVVRGAEPLASRAAEEMGTAIEKINKGGEQVAAEVGREVATLAGKLADKLRAVAERADPVAPKDDQASSSGEPHGGQSST